MDDCRLNSLHRTLRTRPGRFRRSSGRLLCRRACSLTLTTLSGMTPASGPAVAGPPPAQTRPPPVQNGRIRRQLPGSRLRNCANTPGEQARLETSVSRTDRGIAGSAGVSTTLSVQGCCRRSTWVISVTAAADGALEVLRSGLPEESVNDWPISLLPRFTGGGQYRASAGRVARDEGHQPNEPAVAKRRSR